jgi:cyclic beta-1,2-glucan synthetase
LGAVASALIGTLLLFQPLVQPVTWATSPPGFGKFSVEEVMHGVARSIVEAALIPHQAVMALDAIIRVWYRRLISKRKFLEWTTAQLSGWQTAGQARSFLLTISLVSLFSLGVGYAIWLLQPTSLYAAVPYLSLWFISPIIVWRLNLGTAPSPQSISSRSVGAAHKPHKHRFVDAFSTRGL